MSVDYENDRLLITAASGKQASALLPHLSKKWKRLRLQCISDSSADRLRKQCPNAEVIQSDFANLSDAKALLDGVTACFLVTPGFHPREAQHGINIIDAAAENYHSGGPFKHFVFSSVLHSCIRAMSDHIDKGYVEEALIESDVPYTILQPTHIMDTTPLKVLAQQEKPVYKARFDPETQFSYVSAKDIGEAAANVLDEREKHFYATYQLVGTSELLNYVDAMEIVSNVIGKEVGIERSSIDESAEGYRRVMVPKSTPEHDAKITLRNASRMFVYYNVQGLKGNANVLEMLLGRKPLGYREWAEEQVGS